jgi:hypothetical protein
MADLTVQKGNQQCDRHEDNKKRNDDDQYGRMAFFPSSPFYKMFNGGFAEDIKYHRREKCRKELYEAHQQQKSKYEYDGQEKVPVYFVVPVCFHVKVYSIIFFIFKDILSL